MHTVYRGYLAHSEKTRYAVRSISYLIYEHALLSARVCFVFMLLCVVPYTRHLHQTFSIPKRKAVKMKTKAK